MISEVWSKKTKQGIIRLRVADPSKQNDFEGILALDIKYRERPGHKQSAEAKGFYQRRLRENKIIVALCNERIVGFTDYAELTVVEKNFINLKVGEALLCLVMKYLEPGTHQVMVLTDDREQGEKVMHILKKFDQKGLVEIRTSLDKGLVALMGSEIVQIIVSEKKETTERKVEALLSELGWRKLKNEN